MLKQWIEKLLAALKKPAAVVASPVIVHQLPPKTIGKSVEQLAEEIVAREGGYVNDPSDPGGATKYGVTIHTMRALGIDLNKDGVVNTADVKLISMELAKDIYLKHYFYKPGIDKLPAALQASVFDMYVNSGNNAIKILQRLIGVKDDGALGPKTYAAAEAFYKNNPSHASDAYGIARRNYYYALADARPASRKYARRKNGGKGGWIVRAEEFISPKYHLTEAEHAMRVRKWK